MTPLTGVYKLRFFTLLFAVLLATFAQWLTSITLVQSRKVPNVRRLIAYQSFRSFWSFPTNSIWDLYALTCKTDRLQILYKFCKKWISVPNVVHQLTLSLRCKYSRSNFQDAINSICRSAAASDCKPVTSVFYDVIRPESVRGRSNMLIEGHVWRFLGNWFDPKNVVDHRVDPKKALPYVKPRVLNQLAWNSMHGLLQ